MKRKRHTVWWGLVFISLTLAAIWMVVGNRWSLRDNPIASRIVLVYFFVMCAGPYWMIYDCWRHERRLTRKMWLFFIPGGFLWYYFEIVRQRERGRRTVD